MYKGPYHTYRCGVYFFHEINTPVKICTRGFIYIYKSQAQYHTYRCSVRFFLQIKYLTTKFNFFQDGSVCLSLHPSLIFPSSSFTFPGTPYRIFFLYHLRLPCNLYLVLMEQQHPNTHNGSTVSHIQSYLLIF